jgi:hypothetical protein
VQRAAPNLLSPQLRWGKVVAPDTKGGGPNGPGFKGFFSALLCPRLRGKGGGASHQRGRAQRARVQRGRLTALRAEGYGRLWRQVV